MSHFETPSRISASLRLTSGSTVWGKLEKRRRAAAKPKERGGRVHLRFGCVFGYDLLTREIRMSARKPSLVFELGT